MTSSGEKVSRVAALKEKRAKDERFDPEGNRKCAFNMFLIISVNFQ